MKYFKTHSIAKSVTSSNSRTKGLLDITVFQVLECYTRCIFSRP